MSDFQGRNGLSVDARLVDFVEGQAIPGTGLDAATFWADFAVLLEAFAPENRALLTKREDLQAQIDAWHGARAGKPHDGAAYQEFLRKIGYLVPEPVFSVGTENVDSEIATMAGPQLVVPASNARFALNAANARWGAFTTPFMAPMRSMPRRPSPAVMMRCAARR